MVEIDHPLFVSLDKYKGGEHSRTGSRRRANNGLEIHAVPAKLLKIAKGIMTASKAGGKRLRRFHQQTITAVAANSLSGRAAMERRNRLLLTVVDLEHRNQFGDLQDISQTLAQSGQLDFGAGGTRGRI